MKTTDILACAGAASLLLLGAGWVPFIGPVFTLLTPLPFLFYAAKLGFREGLKIAFITVLFTGVMGGLMGYHRAVFLGLEFSLLGVVLSELYRRKMTLSQTVFWGTALMLVCGLVALTLVGIEKGKGPLSMVHDYLMGSLAQTVRVYQQMGADPERAARIQAYGGMAAGVVAEVYLSLVIVATGFVVWFNIVMSRPLFRIGRLEYPDLGPSDRWEAPEWMVWGLIVSGFALFLPIAGIKWLGANILVVILAVYAFQGVSILLFFCNKYRVPGWLRAGIYALIVLQQLFILGLVAAGLFDQWIDFRKMHKRRVIEEP